MSILNCASSASVARGYDYYKSGRVVSYRQISDDEYIGEVQGSDKIPYNVILNIKHPKKSTCDCPFATGKTTCKHMVALYFTINHEEAEDYESWYNNDYDEYDEYYDDEYEEDYYDYDDDYYHRRYDYNSARQKFVKPMFFDELVTNYVNSLSLETLKTILIEELKRNEEHTFNTYLKGDFEKYNLDKNNVHSIIDNVNKRFHKLSHDYDYNYKDYEITLLSKNEKEKISNAYIENKYMKEIIDELILNPEIATYSDYKWIATFYKNNNKKEDVEKYIKRLDAFLDTLKHYSIKNNLPKSNILIIMHLLRENDLKEIANSLIKNCKYEEYVEYILDNTKEIKKLYQNVKEILEKDKYINKEYVVKMLYEFYSRVHSEDIYCECLYYNFLYNKDIMDLKYLKMKPNFDYYINKILNNTKDKIILEKVYIFLNKKKELFELLCNKENEYRLMANVELLKDDYSDEIAIFLKKSFYETIAKEKGRENYHIAAKYITALYKLNDGDVLVDEIVKELNYSEYSKRRALFDEIQKARII